MTRAKFIGNTTILGILRLIVSSIECLGKNGHSSWIAILDFGLVLVLRIHIFIFYLYKVLQFELLLKIALIVSKFVPNLLLLLIGNTSIAHIFGMDTGGGFEAGMLLVEFVVVIKHVLSILTWLLIQIEKVVDYGHVFLVLLCFHC